MITYEVTYQGVTVTYEILQWQGPQGEPGIGGIPEAPVDGVGYRRKDAAWEADPNQIDLGPAIGSITSDLDSHVNDTANPHAVTAVQVQAAPDTVIPDYLVPQDLVIVGGEVEQDASLGTQARLEVFDASITIRPPTNAPAGTSGTIAIVNDEASTVLLDTSFRGQGGLESDLTDNSETVLTWLVEGAGVKCWISKTEWTGTGA